MLDGLVSSLVSPPAYQVHDEDDDDERCQGCTDSDRDDIVGFFVLLANLRFTEVVFVARHEWLHPQINNGGRDLISKRQCLLGEAFVGVSSAGVNVKYSCVVICVLFHCCLGFFFAIS